jgi:hypothetical protein
MKCQLSKIKPGSIVCDPNNLENFYRVIEHITIFDGHDIGYAYGENDQFAYGETKRIARIKNLENGKMYRYPVHHKFLYLEGPNGDTSHLGLTLSRNGEGKIL